MYAAGRGNPWVQEVRDSPRRWSPILATLVAAMFSAAVLFTFRIYGQGLLQAIAAAVTRFPSAWQTILPWAALQGLIFGLFLAAAMLAAGYEYRRPWRVAAGSLEWMLGGAVIGAGGFGAAVAIAAWNGAITPGGSAVSATGLTLTFGAAVVALQSVSEEAFFRGWLQPVLSAGWGPLAGILVSTALFAGLHIIAGVQGSLTGQGGVAMVNLFLGGLLFALLAARSGNLWAPAGAHFAWNWTESGVTGLNGDPTGSILHLAFQGAPAWNGGPDTMNGSLASSVVLLALVGWLSLVRPAQRTV